MALGGSRAKDNNGDPNVICVMMWGRWVEFEITALELKSFVIIDF